MSNPQKINHTGTTTVFKNPIIEKISRTHISLPLIIFSVISSYLVYKGYSEFGLMIKSLFGLFIMGWLLFSLVEYLIHRFLFHLPETTPARKKMVYTMHGVHHEYPNDKERLAMPIPASVTLAFLFFLFFRSLMGDFVFGFLPGFLMGYALYLLVHYMVHAFQPPKNFFKIFWVHHSIHHYKQPDRAFGVSSPFWDLIFRTMPKKVVK